MISFVRIQTAELLSGIERHIIRRGFHEAIHFSAFVPKDDCISFRSSIFPREDGIPSPTPSLFQPARDTCLFGRGSEGTPFGYFGGPFVLGPFPSLCRETQTVSFFWTFSRPGARRGKESHGLPGPAGASFSKSGLFLRRQKEVRSSCHAVSKSAFRF